MEDFLKKLQLSDEAVQIYLKCLGKTPFTYNELFSIIPDMTPDVFNTIMTEFLSLSLFVQINPTKPDIPLHFMAIPPISPITNYYGNIKESVTNITAQIKELMVDSLNKILHAEEGDGTGDLSSQFEEIKNDIDEDTMLQKQDVDDVMEELAELGELKDTLADLRTKLKEAGFRNVSMVFCSEHIKITSIKRVKGKKKQ